MEGSAPLLGTSGDGWDSGRAHRIDSRPRRASRGARRGSRSLSAVSPKCQSKLRVDSPESTVRDLESRASELAAASRADTRALNERKLAGLGESSGSCETATSRRNAVSIQLPICADRPVRPTRYLEREVRAFRNSSRTRLFSESSRLRPRASRPSTRS